MSMVKIKMQIGNDAKEWNIDISRTVNFSVSTEIGGVEQDSKSGTISQNGDIEIL